MTNEQFEELCSAYVLKSLNQNETDEFKKYLETANENEREFYKQALNCSLQLPLSATSAEPSQLVKNKILSQVDTSRRSTSIFPLRYILYSAAAVLIAILSLNLFSSNPVPVENHLLENGVMLISHEAQLPSSFCHSAKNISLVSADGKSESAKLIWCDFHRISYLQINEMSDLEAGESYQLWISNGDGDPVSVGILQARHNIRNKVYEINYLLKLKPSNKSHFTVTIESENGTAHSTARPHMIST